MTEFWMIVGILLVAYAMVIGATLWVGRKIRIYRDRVEQDQQESVDQNREKAAA